MSLFETNVVLFQVEFKLKWDGDVTDSFTDVVEVISVEISIDSSQ